MTDDIIQKATVLVVDDNPINLRLLLDYLNEANIKTLVAKSGERALKQLEYFQPDLILLDVMMPGIDGFETCRQLKENPVTHDIPVIFMTALSDADNKIKGFEAGAVDYITKPFHQEEVIARITTHVTLRNLQKSLQTQVAELDAFAHTVAHDLKHPLSIILAYNEVLMESAPEMSMESLLETFANMHKSGRKAVNIIDELLLLASVRKGSVKKNPLNMADIIRRTQERLAPLLKSYNAEVILPSQWPVAKGYAPWIEEVWVNYLSNGLKYGGEPPRLELGATLDEEDETVRFWVHDNGPGLSQEAQSTLFTEFTRLNKIRAEGHGLGLSIVRRIIDKLGGEVGVESKPGQGSIFYFTLEAISNE